MFVNTVEENQYTDLAARSRLAVGSAQISATTPSRSTGEKHSHDAHSSIGESVFHSSRQEAADLTVDTTPVLVQCLQRLLDTATVARDQGHIHKHQCALAVRRLGQIARTLAQMPQPAPSMRLLTAVRSLCLLLRQCAHNGGVMASMAELETAPQILYGPDGDPLGPAQCWQVLLCQHFTGRRLFQAAYGRLWAAWSMYSRAELEREDGIAESHDRAENAQTMMELLFSTGVLDKHDDTTTTTDEASSAIQHQRDMLAYYQRREIGPWRILYDDLGPTNQLLPGVSRLQDTWASASAAMGRRTVEEVNIRFRVVPHVFRYNGVPVVVKVLSGGVDTNEAETQAVAMQYATEFLLDVACRATWCHPNIVKCLGGFTERFTDNAGNSNESPAHRGALVSDEDHHEAMTGNGNLNDSGAPQERAARAPGVSLPWQLADSIRAGEPIIELGYVTELQGALQTTTAPAHLQLSGVTLSDFLFSNPLSAAAPASSSASPPAVSRHHFTLHEALHVCSQIADALQYIMDDIHEVSEAVQTAWLTVDPANVFVVRVVELDEEDEEAAYQEQQTQQQGGGEGGRGGCQHAKRATSPTLFNTESHVFTDDVVTVGEGVGILETASVESHCNLQRNHMKDREFGRCHAYPSAHAVDDTVQASRAWETTVHVIQGAKTDAGRAEDLLHRRSKHFVVRYNPPCGWTLGEAVGSRWRPHPRATAPSSYVVVQLFLALLTGQVPYAHMTTDREVEEQVFACTKQPHGNTSSTVDVKPSSSGQAYRIPPFLPPMVADWCRRALSLDHTQPPMELEALRATLATIQASLPDDVRHSSLHTWVRDSSAQRHSAGRSDGDSHQEMQACASAAGLGVFRESGR
ncbi:hypothetical protein JKF63_04604 [Porcisia hertigi]|uniref:Uncharacterized protein n=1 Tax=Porcisia hertigi TaxID=2761500 RepID=A0A836LC26_9TRYP|nr:hypothetical protein JKF63_04604 [Porcisia hertigi]